MTSKMVSIDKITLADLLASHELVINDIQNLMEELQNENYKAILNKKLRDEIRIYNKTANLLDMAAYKND